MQHAAALAIRCPLFDQLPCRFVDPRMGGWLPFGNLFTIADEFFEKNFLLIAWLPYRNREAPITVGFGGSHGSSDETADHSSVIRSVVAGCFEFTVSELNPVFGTEQDVVQLFIQPEHSSSLFIPSFSVPHPFPTMIFTDAPIKMIAGLFKAPIVQHLLCYDVISFVSWVIQVDVDISH